MISRPTQAQYLTGQMLIAMPQMGDPRFQRTLIFMCAHSAESAMGLVVNKPFGSITFPDLLEQLNIDPTGAPRDAQVHYGGPVENGRGFVLHTTDYVRDGTMVIDDTFALTATVDILRAMASGKGPERAVLALGYAGWAPGQLENEIQRNGWLTCQADEELLFVLDFDARYTAALKTLGIDPAMLSSDLGHA
jgi:putative transcriptional regulator